MRLPDYISPIVGYRVWQWDAAGLKSLCGEQWHPRQPLAATCRGFERDNTHPVHHSPHIDCTCGVYAAKSYDDLRRSGYDRLGIHGEVSLWGAVVEHERGWRAEYACPKKLFLPVEMLPVSMSLLESRLNILAAYGCDVYIIGREGNMPLWLRGSGYDASALELLVQRCKSWYGRRQQERRIKRGDRVAILGLGITVVEQVHNTHVLVHLWNRTTQKIGRKDTVWNELNMRWEASVSSVVRHKSQQSGW